MQMSYGEIVRSYKEAKEQKKQIGILADLNAVGKDEIAKILYDAGEINKMTYGQYQRHGKKAVKTEPTKTAEVCEQAAPTGKPCRAPEKNRKCACAGGGDRDDERRAKRDEKRLRKSKECRCTVRGDGGVSRGGDGSGQNRVISRCAKNKKATKTVAFLRVASLPMQI